MSPKLSAADRLCLIQTLNALPSAQFEELLVALAPPNGNVPSNTACQANRSAALFEWVESPIGPGLEILEQLLSSIIAKNSQISEKFVAFSISGKISNATRSEVQAFVELLRKKTGDDSIDVAFFEEGSITMILRGSPEGLKKLQELVESGELEGLGIPPVEAVYDVATTSTAARKARLVETLRLTSNSSIVSARDLALESARDLARALARASDQDLARALNLTLDLAYDRVLDLDLDRALERVRASARGRALDLDLARDRAGDLALFLALARDLIRAISSTLDSDLDRVLDDALDRALDSVCWRDLRGADLKNTNLRNIDLRQSDLANVNFTRADLAGANLAGANLAGANLTDANLTDANVTETVFGENIGLTEAYKRDLQERGVVS
ncbi:MAG: pentapeptide repeat-containing protein [Cyanobacteria bacterium P01_A01_bin.17]